jgi:hypothetical protein
MIPVGVKDAGKVLQIFEEFLNWYDGNTELRDDPSWFESCFMSMEDVEMAYLCGSKQKLDLWSNLAPAFDMGATVIMP